MKDILSITVVLGLLVAQISCSQKVGIARAEIIGVPITSLFIVSQDEQSVRENAAYRLMIRDSKTLAEIEKIIDKPCIPSSIQDSLDVRVVVDILKKDGRSETLLFSTSRFKRLGGYAACKLDRADREALKEIIASAATGE